jgi:hypothetical protein
MISFLPILNYIIRRDSMRRGGLQTVYNIMKAGR